MHIRTIQRKFVEVVLFSFCIFFVCGCKLGNSTFEPGTDAPDFPFLVNGQEKHLSDYRGKRVVLHFWASWCENCKEELPALAALHAKLQGRAEILSFGVMEEPQVFMDFASKLKLPYLYATPITPKISSMYKLTGVPESFVLDKEGKFVMMRDPGTGLARVRILGPYSWDIPSVINQLVADDT